MIALSNNRLGVFGLALALTVLTIATFLTPAFGQSVSNTTARKTHAVSTDVTRTPLSVSERERSNAWSLTDTEWRRYQSLLLGIRGSISPANLSPIEVLGIHARDSAERRRYAERWARTMRDDAERILAFQHAYDAAAKRLFSGQPLIDVGKLQAFERERSNAWSLTDTEWRRYQSLLLGIRGSISPANLSPIEVLGIHARDSAERRRYAERWARTMRDDAERILAFQHAYDAAAKRLFSGQPLIDVGKLHSLVQKTSELQADDRVLFFTRVKCPPCDAMLVKLLSRLESIAGIDIYIDDVPGNDDEVIRAWAEEHGIEAKWVGSRRVTLNHDGGALEKIADEPPETPALFVRRNGQLATLSYAEL